MRRQRTQKRAAEPTIALINVVFLMLIFFLLAGTIAPPLDAELKLISLEDQEGRPPPDAMIIHADGQLSFRGQALALSTLELANLDIDFTGKNVAIRIIPDRATPADTLLAVAEKLRLLGAAEIFIVTERGLM